ncbi:hypothetical protein BZA77DRAFT_22051 [Pyronema omphalodes]|nr:hypothetical protein BZA77DRAFT_22051 [Pyronema omphalodes]
MSGISSPKNKHITRQCSSHEKDNTKNPNVSQMNSLIQLMGFTMGAKQFSWDLATPLKYRFLEQDQNSKVSPELCRSNGNGEIDSFPSGFLTQRSCKSMAVFYSEFKHRRTALATTTLFYGGNVDMSHTSPKLHSRITAPGDQSDARGYTIKLLTGEFGRSCDITFASPSPHGPLRARAYMVKCHNRDGIPCYQTDRRVYRTRKVERRPTGCRRFTVCFHSPYWSGGVLEKKYSRKSYFRILSTHIFT